METSQVLRVKVKIAASYGGSENFYAKMSGDGRITLPKLTLDLLRDEEQSLVGAVLEVQLEPVEDTS